MDLKQLTYFTWVYDEGSFTAAAEKARVVQPTLSMQIKRLETELGVKLFDRTRGGVSPTRAGTLLYKHSLAITREMALAADALTEINANDGIAGKIIVGIPPVLSRGVIGATLLEFLDRHPKVEVGIKEAYTGTVVDWVREGKVDFALGAMPARGPGLMQRLVYRDTVFLLSSKPVNGDNYTPCDLSALRGLKVILPSPKHSFATFVRIALKREVSMPITSSRLTVTLAEWSCRRFLIGCRCFPSLRSLMGTSMVCMLTQSQIPRSRSTFISFTIRDVHSVRQRCVLLK